METLTIWIINPTTEGIENGLRPRIGKTEEEAIENAKEECLFEPEDGTEFFEQCWQKPIKETVKYESPLDLIYAGMVIYQEGTE